MASPQIPRARTSHERYEEITNFVDDDISPRLREIFYPLARKKKIADLALQALVQSEPAVKALSRFGVIIPGHQAFFARLESDVKELDRNQCVRDLCLIASCLPFPSLELIHDQDYATMLRNWVSSLESALPEYFEKQIPLHEITKEEFIRCVEGKKTFPGRSKIIESFKDACVAMMLLEEFCEKVEKWKRPSTAFFRTVGHSFSLLSKKSEVAYPPFDLKKWKSPKTSAEYITSYADFIYCSGIEIFLSLMTQSDQAMKIYPTVMLKRLSLGPTQAIDAAFTLSENIPIAFHPTVKFHSQGGAYFPELFVQRFRPVSLKSSLKNGSHEADCCCKELSGTCEVDRTISWSSMADEAEFEKMVQEVCASMTGIQLADDPSPQPAGDSEAISDRDLIEECITEALSKVTQRLVMGVLWRLLEIFETEAPEPSPKRQKRS